MSSIKTIWTNMSKYLERWILLLNIWILLFIGLALVITVAGLFAIRGLSLLGNSDDKILVSALTGIGVVLIFLSLSIKVKQPISTKAEINVITPALVSLMSIMIYALYPDLTISWIVYGLGVIYMIVSIFRNPIEAEKKLLSVERSPLVEEKWRPIFTMLSDMSKETNNLGKEAMEIGKEISSIFQTHRRLKDGYKRSLKDMVDIYLYACMLEQVPKEYIDPFKAKLWEALESQGVKIWSPEIGKPAPDGCRQTPASQTYSYSEGTVAEVLAPGFRIIEGDQLKIIEPPWVTVVTQKKEDS